MGSESNSLCVAIACGGTGGHLFPGRAVGDALRERGCSVTLLISPKEVDRRAVSELAGFTVLEVAAVGWSRRRPLAFVRGFASAYRVAGRSFRLRPPGAVLGMGGFVSAAPVLAGRRCGARAFLHESNAIPGRANRWLSPLVHSAFVGFPAAGERLRCRRVVRTGTPVRGGFRPGDPAASRLRFGLDPAAPVLLVMGGSQGASGLNELVMGALPRLVEAVPELQFIHLTGSRDLEKVRAAYVRAGRRVVVEAFWEDMPLAMSAAVAAVSRAGASTLAELAAMRLPAVLVPFPQAADNHQWHNARAMVDAGAARLVEQSLLAPPRLVSVLGELVCDREAAGRMREALRSWDRPLAAADIATAILETKTDATRS